MSVIVFLLLFVLIYRFAIVKLRNWLDSEPYMSEHPLPLWVYLIFLVLSAIPSAAVASLVP